MQLALVVEHVDWNYPRAELLRDSMEVEMSARYRDKKLRRRARAAGGAARRSCRRPRRRSS